MRAIKLIKYAERKVPHTRSRIKAATRRDRSSQEVRSWVVEFKKTRRGESLIAFDSLFKDALLPSEQIKKNISQTCEEEALTLGPFAPGGVRTGRASKIARQIHND